MGTNAFPGFSLCKVSDGIFSKESSERVAAPFDFPLDSRASSPLVRGEGL